jgi:hypothetical protein
MSLLTMTQNCPLPSTTPTSSTQPALKDYAGKLYIAKEGFWDAGSCRNTGSWPITRRFGRTLPISGTSDISDAYYSFSRDEDGSYVWETAIPEGLPRTKTTSSVSRRTQS